ncbi:hypothetical protein KUCAC02_035125, partial [Chaenocephalus aceratus]
ILQVSDLPSADEWRGVWSGGMEGRKGVTFMHFKLIHNRQGEERSRGAESLFPLSSPLSKPQGSGSGFLEMSAFVCCATAAALGRSSSDEVMHGEMRRRNNTSDTVYLLDTDTVSNRYLFLASCRGTPPYSLTFRTIASCFNCHGSRRSEICASFEQSLLEVNPMSSIVGRARDDIAP